MQDEILKHTKKAYTEMKNKEHSFWHKTKEIFIEVAIIVFAVSLSIWLHGWSEHRHQQKEVKEFLVDLKEDLSKDIENFSREKERLEKTLPSLTKINALTRKDIDTMRPISELNMNLITRRTNNGNYEGFKSSGKINFIENKKVKKALLSYYQESMPPLEEIEKFRNTKGMEIIEHFGAKDDGVNALKDPLTRTKIRLLQQITESLIKAYDSDIKEAKDILSEIEKK